MNGKFQTLSYLTEEREFVIDPPVLKLFYKNRQTRWYHREAGGQLFAKVGTRRWTIVAATGPRKGDVRSFNSFIPNRRTEQLEINAYYERGLEFVGDWHTHPAAVPAPSCNDIESIKNVVRESQTIMPGFLLCIVGQADFPCGLWFSFESRDGLSHRLKATTL